jgi:hypothetical protein
MSVTMFRLLATLILTISILAAFLSGEHFGRTETRLVILTDEGTDQAWIVGLRPGEKGELNGIKVEVR